MTAPVEVLALPALGGWWGEARAGGRVLCRVRRRTRDEAEMAAEERAWAKGYGVAEW